MFCRKCGAVLKETASFCVKCGAKVKSSVNPNPEKPISIEHPAHVTPSIQTKTLEHLVQQSEKPKKKRKSRFTVGIVAAGILVAVFIGMMLSDQDRNEKNDGAEIAVGTQPVISEVNEIEPEIPKAEDSVVSVDDPEAEMNAAYADVVAELEKKYGIGFYDDDGPHGVVIVRKIDFDKDGVDELLCAFHNDSLSNTGTMWTASNPRCDGTCCDYCLEVWGWKDEEAVQLTHLPILPEMLSIDRDVKLLDQGNSVYMILELFSENESANWAFALKNDEWIAVEYLYYYSEYDFATDVTHHYYARSGETISEEEYWQVYDQFFNWDNFTVIPLYYGEDQFQITEQIIEDLKGASKLQTAPTSNSVGNQSSLDTGYQFVYAPNMHSISSVDPLPQESEATHMAVDLDGNGTMEQFLIALGSPNGIIIEGICSRKGFLFHSQLEQTLWQNGCVATDEYGEWDVSQYPIQISCFDWNRDGTMEVFIASGDPALGYADVYEFTPDQKEPFSYLCTLSGAALVYDESTGKIDSLIGSSNRIIESYSYPV